MNKSDAVTAARRPTLLATALMMLVTVAGFVAAPGAGAASTNLATAYQLNAAHDGTQTASLALPLARVWSVTLPGPVSYPLIVDGTVYVTAANGGTSTSLYAINQATGATLWSRQLGGSRPWSALAYDAGQIFTINTDGLLSAVDAASGQTNWATSLSESMFTSAPTPANGDVYVGGSGSGGKLYAVTQATGQVAWSASVENGDDSSPAVDGNGVYVTYACGQDYGFDPSSGTLVWHHTAPCEGGGGKTPVLADGHVYGRDGINGNLILSAGAGATQGSFNSTPAPAVGGGHAFMEYGGELTAVGQSGLGTTAWTFSGDSQLDTAPLLVGNLVFEGSSNGAIYAVDAGTGTSMWSTNVGVPVSGPDEQNVSGPLTGLAAGEGTLIVPAGSTLTAYASASLDAATPSNVQPPAIIGAPAPGRPIAVDVGQWSALATSYAYQWMRCDGAGDGCVPIQGATTLAYTPGSSDAGSTLRVTITATNAGGTSAPMTTAASSALPTDGPPVNASLPSVAGTATVGQLLTANPGGWAPAATRYSYQWLACTTNNVCADIAGATDSSLHITEDQIATRIEVRVTAANAAGSSVPAVSASTAPVRAAGGDIPEPTRLTLTSSRNPARSGDTIVFSAAIGPFVDGGTIAWTENGRPLLGCTSVLRTPSRGVTCAVFAAKAGAFNITATYSGDSLFASSAATLTQVVKPAILPPKTHVGQSRSAKAAGTHPNFSLTLTAARTNHAPHPYRFTAENVSCSGGASAVQITVGASTTQVPCTARLVAASKQLAEHRTYKITARAVRFDRKRRITARGPLYRLSLYMPGDEARWPPAVA